ncbi:MAG: carboxypeptidase-like regulatory domain-containing protein [Muribaculaceae bacterium]|nr:carboxypeptidase-like regulatory domain-containing protein [Muribaculaceae bacterium]
MNPALIRYLVALLMTVIAMSAHGQEPGDGYTRIKGVVTDSVTGEGIPYAQIFLIGSQTGALTNDQGGFTIVTGVDFEKLQVTAVGYMTQEIVVPLGEYTELDIKLAPTMVMLNEVIVSKTGKYVKEGNPAVAFVERLRSRHNDYNPLNHEYYNYDKYERVSFGFNNFNVASTRDLFAQNYHFLKEYVDTSDITGKMILPWSIQEKVSDEHYRKSPSTHREVVRALNHAGIDEQIDTESLKKYIDDVFSEMDIFSSDINFMRNRFVSPLSSLGPDFYKYFLDTLMVDGVECYELTFAPFTPETFGFLGRLYVPVGDSTMFISKVMMNVPHNINLNYVNQVYLEQEYIKASDGTRLKVRDDLLVEFKIAPKTPEIYARRQTYYDGHNFKPPRDMRIFDQSAEVLMSGNISRDESYWIAHRPVVAAKNESTVRDMLSRLRESKTFYWCEKVAVAILKGYINTSAVDSKFDIGPLGSTIGGNSLEGVRLRLGGMTTARLNPRWFGRFYVAYGTRDEKFKYMGQVEYSFLDKKKHSSEFPVNSLSLTHRYDVDKLGQHFLYTNPNNVFFVVRRHKDNKMIYLRETKLEYKLETQWGFSFAASLQHRRHEASVFLPFTCGDGNSYGHYNTAGFNLTLVMLQARSSIRPVPIAFPSIKTLLCSPSHTPSCREASWVVTTPSTKPKLVFRSDFGFRPSGTPILLCAPVKFGARCHIPN